MVLPDPLDRPPDGVDDESEWWWAELMGEPPSPAGPPLRVRRRRSGPPRASRTVAAFMALLVGALGAITLYERNRPSFRASYDDGRAASATIQGESGSSN